MSDRFLNSLCEKIENALSSNDPIILENISNYKIDFLSRFLSELKELAIEFKLNTMHRDGINILLRATRDVFANIKFQQSQSSKEGDKIREGTQQERIRIQAMTDDFVQELFHKSKDEMLAELNDQEALASKIDWLSPIMEDSNHLLDAIRCVSILRQYFEHIDDPWRKLSDAGFLRDFQKGHIASKLKDWGQDFKTPKSDKTLTQYTTALIRDGLKLFNEANPINALLKLFDTLIDLQNTSFFSKHDLKALHNLRPQIVESLKALKNENIILKQMLNELKNKEKSPTHRSSGAQKAAPD